MICFCISVESLPITNNSLFFGASALPSLSENGTIVQYGMHFYELICSESNCNWKEMEQKLSKSVRLAVMMYLPTDYAC